MGKNKLPTKLPTPEPCEYCGAGEAYYEPDPYAEGMSGDDTPRWICSECRGERVMAL